MSCYCVSDLRKWVTYPKKSSRFVRHTSLNNYPTQAENLSPDQRTMLQINRAALYLELGTLNAALKAVNAALSITPDHPKALLVKVQVLVALERTAEAMALLDDFLSKPWDAWCPVDTLLAAVQLKTNLSKRLSSKSDPLTQSVAQTALPDPSLLNGNGTATHSSPPAPEGVKPSVKDPNASVKDANASDTSTSGPVSEREAALRPEPDMDLTARRSALEQEPPGPSGAPKVMVKKTPPARKEEKATSPSISVSVTRAAADHLIQQAIVMINENKGQQGADLLSPIFESQGLPKDVLMSAYVIRGTARALDGAGRDLVGAEKDFTKAIECFPSYIDAYKRRFQVRCALRRYEGALQDMDKCIEATNNVIERADLHLQKAKIYFGRRDYARALRELLPSYSYNKESLEIVMMLGMVQMTQGNLDESINVFRKALLLSPNHPEALLNLGHALKEKGRFEEAMTRLQQGAELDKEKAPGALKLIGQIRQALGDHAGAVEALTRALEVARKLGLRTGKTLDLYFLRAVCLQADGFYAAAQSDFRRCQAVSEDEAASGGGEDTRGLRNQSFCMEDVLYRMFDRMDDAMATYCLDRCMHPKVKEGLCKKAAPTAELRKLLKDGERPQIKSFKSLETGPEGEAWATRLLSDPSLKATIAFADLIGSLMLYRYQGFPNSTRQLRAGGLGAVELAQTLTEVLRVRRGGAGAEGGGAVQVPNAMGSQGEYNPGPGTHPFHWRDAMDILVRWRQAAEPNDAVLWVDLLSKEEFESGFGSHTPLYTGQTKCVRYYGQFDRAFKLFKELAVKRGHVLDALNRPIEFTAAQREAIQGAKHCKDLYQIIGRDSWICVPLESQAFEGRELEGTRLTLVKVRDVPDGFEFSIRTPVTPPRWKEFEFELETHFETALKAMALHVTAALSPSYDPSSPASLDLKKQVLTSVLTFAYYWYNFMPLARGTAAVGYLTILGMLLAARIPVTCKIPEGVQPDWEAILSRGPAGFIRAVAYWICPEVAPLVGSEPPAGWQAERVEVEVGAFEGLGLVERQLGTLRGRLMVLKRSHKEWGLA